MDNLCVGTSALQAVYRVKVQITWKEKVKQSRYRPGVAQRVPGS